MPKLLSNLQQVSAHNRTGTMGAGSLPSRREGARIAHPGAFSVHGLVRSTEPKRSVGSLIASLCDAEHQDTKSKLIATARPSPRRRDTKTETAPHWNCTTAHNGKLEAQPAAPKPRRPPVTSPKAAPAPAVLRIKPPPPPSIQGVSPRGRSPKVKTLEDSPTAHTFCASRPKDPSRTSPTYSLSSSPTRLQVPFPPSKASMRASTVSASAADKSSPHTGDRSQRLSLTGRFTSMREMDDYVRRLERELAEERAAVAQKERSLAELQARFGARESARRAMVKQLEQCQRVMVINSRAVLESSGSILPSPTGKKIASTAAQGGTEQRESGGA